MKNTLSKKKKITIGIVTPITALILVFLILCITTMSTYSPAFLGRVLTHWDSSVTDYKIFPERTIQKSEKTYSYTKNIDSALDDLTVNYKSKQKTLNEFVKSTDTTSFIIVKNDEIVYVPFTKAIKNDKPINQELLSTLRRLSI